MATIITLLFTHTISIALAFGALVAGIVFITLRGKNQQTESSLIAAWPEVIDHLMSGIQSGLSLTESLADLSTRGPEILRPAFTDFRNSLYKHGDVGEAIGELKSLFHHHGSDQIFEALLISKSLGGSELLAILRTLGDFLRQDLALRREIEVKHSWIKNSAHLSAAAPWMLLLKVVRIDANNHQRFNALCDSRSISFCYGFRIPSNQRAGQKSCCQNLSYAR